ncbi:inositol polyphosphate-5-phosphatase A-like isoform X2 [Haliotis rufescens]|uniref:inositol polyphosphate-5-phosphatase A-like isoform X2 n=1 Tax=Haliotis rufescens TaxID=6454 RepID=UPI001EAFB0B8|nr:inositol polyphosphate-5-phosphatase A-like isoform X2 [Haliotis rufescens]
MDEEHLAVLLITANVGSIFEEPEQMFKPWLKEFLGCIERLEPCFVALHCQEVGGKNYETSMQHVNQFVKTILASEELVRYDRARVFLDEDYTAADKFTALGNLYFVHDTVDEVNIFDFVENKFVLVEGREVLSGNIENIQIKEKAKFPQHFFPEFKWSRKGFLRTRWNLNNCIFDLVNIHLFHDASNIIAMQASPSIYNGNRQQALMHTLKRFEGDKYDKVPMLLFGDFNFRLDTNLLIKALTAKTTSEQTLGKKDQISKIVYTEEGNEKVVLTVEAKGFDYHDKHEDLFFNTIKWLKQYDTEMTPFKERLSEYEISFPPSYPFSEDVNDGTSYMKTRCPSWCDRILISHSAKDVIFQDEKFHRPEYSLIGKEVCMGDHKPVYLSLHLKPGKVPTPKAELVQLPGAGDIIIPSTQVKISEVDTTRYIHIRQGDSSTRVFRETSV